MQHRKGDPEIALTLHTCSLLLALNHVVCLKPLSNAC